MFCIRTFLLSDVNGLLQELIYDVKLFADDTSFFSTVNCVEASASAL